MRLTLIEKKNITSDIESFVFNPDVELTWEAGQFLHYFLPHENPDDRKEDRYFTISSAPFEKSVVITTRLFDDGSSFKKALNNLNIGDSIEATGPEGDFVIRDPNKHYIFIAGGIGITPFRSILKELDHNEISLNIDLLYANRNEEYPFDEEFKDLQDKHSQFKVHKFTSPRRIEEQDIRTVASSDINKSVYYVSGPKPMVQHYEAMLKDMGISEENIVTDFFPGYSEI